MSKLTYTLLVVDDDPSIRESLRKLLNGEGYHVVAAANGLEAVEMFCRDRQKFDLLLVDLNMPLKNGWATLDRFLETDPFLPVLIVTGQTDQHAMAEAAGVDALVEKPVDVPALLEIIRGLLARPTTSRHQRTFPFHFVRAAVHTRHPAWRDQDLNPYLHGGLNE